MTTRTEKVTSELTFCVNQKPINKKASGAAMATIKKHNKDSEIKLLAACFWYVNLPNYSRRSVAR